MNYTCSQCQAPVVPGQRFCPHCGVAFQEPVPGDPTAKPTSDNPYPWLDSPPVPPARRKSSFSFGRVIGALILIFIVLPAVISALNSSDQNASTPPTPITTDASVASTADFPAQANTSPDLQVLNSHVKVGEYGNRSVVGQIKNNTDHTISYAEVEINLYDKDSNQVGSAIDNIDNLEPGKTWNFDAGILEDSATSYKIKDVTGL